jgi:hypothetical protein
MIGVFAVLRPLQEMSPEGIFPYVVYMVPNALFPLMTYFLWIRLSLYRSYIALYTAGKTIGVVSIIGWCMFTFRTLITADSMTVSMIMEQPNSVIAGFILILSALDALTIFGGLMLNNKLNHLEM